MVLGNSFNCSPPWIAAQETGSDEDQKCQNENLARKWELDQEDSYLEVPLSGLATRYYPNGQIEYQGAYSLGREFRTWRWYAEEGSLVRESVEGIDINDDRVY